MKENAEKAAKEASEKVKAKMDASTQKLKDGLDEATKEAKEQLKEGTKKLSSFWDDFSAEVGCGVTESWIDEVPTEHQVVEADPEEGEKDEGKEERSQDGNQTGSSSCCCSGEAC